MSLPEYLYPHVAPFLMLLARLGGLFVFAPFLSSGMIPARLKALLLFMLTLALYPIAGPVAVPAADPLTLGVAVGAEALIGIALGLIASLPLYAAQLGGQLMDHQIGLGLAGVYNPALDTETTILADLVLNIGIALFVSLGGLEALFIGVASSIAVTPLGAAATAASPLDLIVSLVASGFELALRVAAPVLGVITVETIAGGIVAKTMPQINIMSIGFAIKIIAGLTTLVAALSPINGAVGDALSESVSAMLNWAAPAR